jgi:hypothetical protein
VALIVLCVMPAGALAAPANDDFANRELLGGSLPIEEPGSNEGATSEENEPFFGFESGHSVWFEWVAPSSGWFTIGACDSNFAAGVGIFTGTEFSNLTRVVSGAGNEGPDCPNQRQYTFQATAATHYVIRVAGQSIPTPEGPPPPVEGTFTLKIEETPPPPNDDFADATLLEAPVSEEPGGARFYAVFAQGYNWNATTEPGEFPYGTNSGASVWYRWTPPETAKYRIGGPCCGQGLNFALFSGGFGLEDEMLAATGSAEATVLGGTTYWISVYGTPQMAATEPSTASFDLFITAELPPLPVSQPPSAPPASRPAADTTAPETTIDKSNLRIAGRSATFWFSASEATQGFLCQLDKGPYRPCGSPRTYKHLKTGRHAFRVRAVDVAGNVDASPAVARFKVPRPYKGRR